MHTSSSRRSAPGSIGRRISRRPLTSFSLVLFGVGWPALALLASARYGHGSGGGIVLGRPAEEWLGLGLVALVLAPAAIWITRRADGAPGTRALLRRALHWRVGWGWAAVVALALPAVATTLALAAGGRWRADADASLLTGYAWALLGRTLTINLWEELAWAGFFQTRLQRRHGAVPAALITAVPFAAIHVPLLFTGDAPLLASFAGLLVLSVVFRLLVGVVLLGTGGSVLAVGVLHAAFNETANAEGVLHAALTGVDLSWEAPAAAVVLAAFIGRHLLLGRRLAHAEARVEAHGR